MSEQQTTETKYTINKPDKKPSGFADMIKTPEIIYKEEE